MHVQFSVVAYPPPWFFPLSFSLSCLKNRLNERHNPKLLDLMVTPGESESRAMRGLDLVGAYYRKEVVRVMMASWHSRHVERDRLDRCRIMSLRTVLCGIFRKHCRIVSLVVHS